MNKKERNKSGQKLFNCSKCGKSMHGQASLFRHLSTMHMNREKQYCCSICSKRYQRKDAKVHHEKTCLARFEVPTIIPTAPASAIKKSIKCEDDLSISEKAASSLGLAWPGVVYLLQCQGRTLTLLDVGMEGRTKQLVCLPLPFPASQVLPHPSHCGVLLLSCVSRMLLLHMEPGGIPSSSKELALPFLTSSCFLSWPLGDPDWGRVALTSPSSLIFLTTTTGARLAYFTLAGDTIKASALSRSHLFLLGDQGGVYIQELPKDDVGITDVTHMLAPPPSLPGSSLTYLPSPDLLVVTYTGGLVLVLGPGGEVLHSLQAPGTVTSLVDGPALVGRLEEGGFLLLTLTPSLIPLPKEVEGVVVLENQTQEITLLQLVFSTQGMSLLCLSKIGPKNPRPRNIGVVCNICDSILSSRRNFDIHTEKMHRKEILTCNKCHLYFQDKQQLRSHLSAKCRFACPFKDSSVKCGFVTTNKEKVRKHMKMQHDLSEKFLCDHCDFKGGFQTLADHRKKEHPNSSFSNSNGGTTGNQDQTISANPNYVVEPKYRYTCLFKDSPMKCSFVSRKRNHMKMHIKRSHEQHSNCDSLDIKSKITIPNDREELKHKNDSTSSSPNHKEEKETESTANKDILIKSGMECLECEYCGDELNTQALMNEHMYAMHQTQVDQLHSISQI